MTAIFIRIVTITVLTTISMRISDFLFKKALKKKNRIHLKFMKGFLRTFLFIAGILTLGMQFTTTKEISFTLLRNTALLVAILGFAAQQTLNDILSGFMLSWYKPFDIGERIHLVNKDITGIVEDLTLRHTVIRSFDNNRIIIPNSVINKEILRNSNYEDSVIGNFLEIGVSSGSDIHQAMELILDIIKSHPCVITTPTYQPGLLVKSVSKEGFYLKATVWTKNIGENFQASSDIRISVHRAFQEYGIKLL